MRSGASSSSLASTCTHTHTGGCVCGARHEGVGGATSSVCGTHRRHRTGLSTTASTHTLACHPPHTTSYSTISHSGCPAASHTCWLGSCAEVCGRLASCKGQPWDLKSSTHTHVDGSCLLLCLRPAVTQPAVIRAVHTRGEGISGHSRLVRHHLFCCVVPGRVPCGETDVNGCRGVW